MLIKEIYNKNPNIINESALISEYLRYLLKSGSNGSIVLDSQNKLIGILSVQDIASAVIPHEFKDNPVIAASMYKIGFFTEMVSKLKNKQVKEIMRKDFTKVSLEDNIMAVIADFLKNDLYIVPVVENNKLVGVVSRTEIRNALAKSMDLI